MSVGAYALTSLQAARDYLGSVPAKPGIWIYSPSPTGATAATVEVSDTTLTLTITGGASAGTSTFTLGAAAYDTLTELVAGINALTGKWLAGVIYNGAAASTDLVAAGSQSALGAANELTLLIEDNYGIERLVDRATGAIEFYCGRIFKTRSYDREFYSGSGRPYLTLRQYPVTRVFRVSAGWTNAFSVTNTTAKNFAAVDISPTVLRLIADGVSTSKTLSDYATIGDLITAINAVAGWTASAIANTDRAATYTGSDGSTKVGEIFPMPAQRCKSPNVAYVQVWDEELDDYYIIGGGRDENNDAGILSRAGNWRRGETYIIDYIAGYTTIPSALEEACLMLIKYGRDKTEHDGSVSSESLGDYSYTLGDLTRAWPEAMRQQVAMFRAIRM